MSEECCNAKALELIWARGGYSGENFASAVMAVCGAKVEVVKRIKDGFEVLPRRWVVERTFGWLVGLRQKSSPNQAQTGFISSKHVTVEGQPIEKSILS